MRQTFLFLALHCHLSLSVNKFVGYPFLSSYINGGFSNGHILVLCFILVCYIIKICPGAENLLSRAIALGRYLGKGEHDLILLSELWDKEFHTRLNRALPSSYHMTQFEDLNSDGCYTDIQSPRGCAGEAKEYENMDISWLQ